MTDIACVRAVVDLYQKHGWVLRRFVVASELARTLAECFSDIPITPSELDAAWFSRPPAPGNITWELRYLGEPPFALLTSVDEADGDFEDSLTDVELRLIDAVTAKNRA